MVCPFRCHNCIFFGRHSLSKVRKLHPLKHTVKPITLDAVLYVVYSGAQWIFWSNGASGLKEEVDKFKMAARAKGLIYTTGNIMQASRHFTYNGEASTNQSGLYRRWNWSVPSIQKVWRPVKHSHEMIDYRAPPVLVPADTYVTETLTDCLFNRNTFWSLGPLFTTSRDPGYIWSFWIQRLLWEYGGNIELFSPLRNGHFTYNNEHVENADGHISALTLLGKKLSNWRCDVNKTFDACVKDLAQRMVGWKYFTQKEISVINVWFSLLGTIQPIRIKDWRKGSSVKPTNGYRVMFNPGRPVLSHTNQSQEDKGRFIMENPFNPICKNYRQKSAGKPVIPSAIQLIDDILLIIIFNRPGFLDNIAYLNYVHGRYFSHILMCAHSLDEFKKYAPTKNKVSFIEINLGVGVLGYQCMMEAMQMGYDVKGYLQISDDVILNTWNIAKLPRNRIWFQSRMRVGRLASKRVPNIHVGKHVVKHWWPWSSQWGVGQVYKVWQDYSAILKDPKVAPIIQKFLKTLTENSRKPDGVYYEASDIYYIPSSLKEDYVFLSSWFLKERVYLEIAIPTVINGLARSSEIVRMPGTYLWYSDRVKFRKTFNPSHCFLHPFKLKHQLKEESGAKFYCEEYLPLIERSLP
ncbi:probable glycosyltransferase STELLO1 [Gigantopelta aegis]|uniref:probable glycosyltransferase STELLO1 n=1 Tax=Gigantopelta aegis TaxID=1735272 RepID=UPI001B88D606|nr:probable glycosyltransferase STELLO1 [Gigantopelta aegis]